MYKQTLLTGTKDQAFYNIDQEVIAVYHHESNGLTAYKTSDYFERKKSWQRVTNRVIKSCKRKHGIRIVMSANNDRPVMLDELMMKK